MRAKLAAPVLLVLAGIGLLGTAAAFGYWVVGVNSGPAGSASADALPSGATPGTPTVTPSPNSSTVTFSFTRVNTTTGNVAIPASDYTIKRYPATGGSAVTVSVSCSGTTTITCTETSVPDGSWKYTDTPVVGTHWVGTESAQSATVMVDTTGPTIAVTYPVSSTTYGTNWIGTISGTASDATSGVASTAVALEDTTTSKWWTGTGFSGASPSYRPATGTTSWSYDLAATNLTSGHFYSVIGQATDAVGNVGTSTTVSFSYDTTAPSVAVSYPVNNTTYGTNWTGAITGTSSANATGASISTVKLSLQQGSGASACWTGAGSTFTASCPNYIAVSSGTTSWSRTVPVSALTSGNTYNVLAQATDSLNNVGTTTSVTTFTYSTTTFGAADLGNTTDSCTSFSTSPVTCSVTLGQGPTAGRTELVFANISGGGSGGGGTTITAVAPTGSIGTPSLLKSVGSATTELDYVWSAPAGSGTSVSVAFSYSGSAPTHVVLDVVQLGASNTVQTSTVSGAAGSTGGGGTTFVARLSGSPSSSDGEVVFTGTSDNVT